MTADDFDFHQPESGYRFSEDSILLAEFAGDAHARAVADLGAGCGVAGLTAVEKGAFPRLEKMFFVEAQVGFAASLNRNLAERSARFSAELTAMFRDWRELEPGDFDGLLDYVLVNPPYYDPAKSRAAKNPEADRARREILGGLPDLLDCFTRLIAPGGRAALCWPTGRLAELSALLSPRGLSIQEKREVAAGKGLPPRLVLLELTLHA